MAEEAHDGQGERPRRAGTAISGLSAAAVWLREAMGARALADALEAERPRWAVWLPVAFGAGVVIYFGLGTEPHIAVAVALPVIALVVRRLGGSGVLGRVVTAALLAAAVGFAVAKVRTEWTGAPVLERRMMAADIEGRVVLVEPAGKRGQRITIRVSRIAKLAPGATPRTVRVRAMRGLDGLAPGDAIRIRATLSPPSGPALPGGYDFARTAWFQGLGGIGYALKPPVIDEDAGPAPSVFRVRAAIEAFRHAIGARILAALPGETGAIANSLVTGERGGISQETNEAYRDSGLLHILSISGLHMVIMGGAVFLAVRLATAAVPALVLRYPTKKWAAVAAGLASFAYLMISGASVPTVRAFIMISIMFLAVLADRPALAMRNVALAALLILVLMPESVLDVGFQMSFAAVVALIAAYEVARERGDDTPQGAGRRLGLFLGGIVLSTVIASLAVAPFAAYHFHRSQQFALLANLIAIPICNLVVMPAGLITLVLMPLGLEALPLTIMGWGIEVMTWTARLVADLPGAVLPLPEISTLAFGLMVAGGIWLTLWQRRWRLAGVAAIAAGVAVAPWVERPAVLVAADGRLVAARGADGRFMLLGGRGQSFEAKRWLEHDGDGRDVAAALKAGGWRCDGAGCTVTTGGRIVAVARSAAALRDDCRRAAILVADVPVMEAGCYGPAVVIDYPALKAGGAHAIYVAVGANGERGALRVETVAAARGNRPWTPAVAVPATSAARSAATVGRVFRAGQ